MSVLGCMSTVMWTELYQAIIKDLGESKDFPDGKCGPAVREWIVSVATQLLEKPHEP